MNISCPQCRYVYRFDPARVPVGGARTRCGACGTPFLVAHEDEAQRPGAVVVARRVEQTAAAVASSDTAAPAKATAADASDGPTEAPPARPADGAPAGQPADESRAERPADQPAPERPAPPPVFGPQDPRTRARRLARALVSDIKVYNPDRWEASHAAGTLRTEFRQEILKSWDEFVGQVGEEMAKRTPFFRDALNDILAGGERVF